MAGKETLVGVFKKNAEQACALGLGGCFGTAVFNRAIANIDSETSLITGLGAGIATAAIFVIGKYMQNKPR